MMVLVEMMMEMMVMMIPMKSILMVVFMAMISPLREGISLEDFCLPESSFSLYSFCPAEAAKPFCGCSPSLRVSRGLYTPTGDAGGRPGWPHHLVA